MSAADPLLVPDCNLLIHLVAEQFLRAKHRQPPLGLLDAGHDSSDFAVRDLAAAFEDGSVALSDASLGGLWRYLTDKSRKVPQDLATRYTYELEDLAADSSHYYDHLTWAALEADADQVIHAWETRCPSIVANGQVDFEDAVQSSAYAHIFDANHGRAVVFATADVRFALAQAHTNPNPHNPTRLYPCSACVADVGGCGRIVLVRACAQPNRAFQKPPHDPFLTCLRFCPSRELSTPCWSLAFPTTYMW